jgi:spore coat polysaccharide biosynthesis protein SpsF
MNIVASIQARMGSKRLPGKVLKNISGKPMLLRHVERLRLSSLIDHIVIATSLNPRDDLIEKFCNDHSILCFRGSEDNVLNRVASLISEYNVDVHVEFCGDSPLIDFQIVDEFIDYFLKHIANLDYVSNTLKTTYPPGQEVAVYSGQALVKLDNDLDINDPLREHVGFNITRFSERFRIHSLEAPAKFNYPDIYLEVDTENDLELIQLIFKYFLDSSINYFSLSEIIELLLSHPEWVELNNKEHRRWKGLRGK